jgi:methylglutaconyl-CoA hydratase
MLAGATERPMSSESPVVIRSEAGVLWLTIDRAEVRNALNEAVIAALTAAILEAPRDPAARAIVVTGAGDRAFCAGADLKPGAATFAFDPSQPSTTYATLLRAATACTLPLIARVNGHCLAGGMGLLAVSDMAVASSAARFGLPEVKVGLFPMQVAAVLAPLIPRRTLAELCLTGEPISALEALEVGLVNYVVEPSELDAKLAWLIDRTIGNSPTAIRRGKYALRAIAEMTTEQALAYMEGQLVSLALTHDAAEGLRAFNEKRAPVWTGR